MPWSASCFDEIVEQTIARLRPASMLDIGAGAGKYGSMMRRASPETWTVAVEAQAEYVEGYGLEALYDEVMVGPAEQLLLEPDLTVDLVIFGDVIEHMRKSVGTDLLHYFAYRSRCILCIYPQKYVQYSLQGRAPEAHISVWGPQDFSWFQTQHHQQGMMNLAVVTGFLADPDAVIMAEGAQPLGPPRAEASRA